MESKSRCFLLVFFLCLIGLLPNSSSNLAAAESAGVQSDSPSQLGADAETVTIEVIALDKKGNPVRNLKKEDFQLYEDGKKQEILSINEVSPEPVNFPAGQGPLPRGKTVLIVFDDRAIAQQYLKTARDTAERFVTKNMRPQDSFAVAAYANSMKILQDFTNDREKLLTAIKQNPDSVRGSASTHQLLISLDKIINAIAPIGGQKSILIYTQSGFTAPGNTDLNFYHSNLTGDLYKNVLKSAKISNVIFYSINPETLASAAGPTIDSPVPIGTSPLFLNPDRAARIQVMGSYVSVRALSTESGGYSIFDTNNLETELDKLGQQLSNYYVLSFRSNNPVRDAAYRKLRIRTKAKGVSLKYRPGYQAQSPAEKSSVRTETLLTSIEFTK